MLGKSGHVFVVLWLGRSCQEMWGTILRVGNQDDSTTPKNFNSMHWWPSFQRRRNEICCTSIFSNCSKMFILDTNWKTWYSVVSEQTCPTDHKINQSMWPAFGSFDLLHSTHEWIHLELSCGWYCTTVQMRTVSRLRFCGRSWGFKIHFWRNIVHFRKSYICSKKLDVWEANISFTQFNRIRNHLFGCRIETDSIPVLDLLDLIVLVLGNTTQNHDRTEKPVVCRDKNHVHQQSRGMFNVLNNVDFVPQTNIRIKKLCCMCFQNPQNCSRLVVRSNQSGFQNPNQIHPHQKTTHRHANQGEFHTWREESSSVCV